MKTAPPRPRPRSRNRSLAANQQALFEVQKFHVRQAANCEELLSISTSKATKKLWLRHAFMHRRFVDAITPFVSVPSTINHQPSTS